MLGEVPFPFSPFQEHRTWNSLGLNPRLRSDRLFEKWSHVRVREHACASSFEDSNECLN